MRSKIAVTTDSNSGIAAREARELGVGVVHAICYINDEGMKEDIDLSQEEFYKRLEENAEVRTAMPTIEDTTNMWRELLKENEAVIHLPMSHALSGACQEAMMLSHEDEFEGKVWVVDNQRVSLTLRQSCIDALEMIEAGKDAKYIYDKLMENAMESSIYIMLDTLYYLKKGGRITPAAAAIGTLLRIKPVLQIQGERLDAFAKARTLKQGKDIMINQIKDDCAKRFGAADGSTVHFGIAYTKDIAPAEEFKKEVMAAFPNYKEDIPIRPLSLSVSCHIGPGAVAIVASKKIDID